MPRRAHNDERRETLNRDRVLRTAMAVADERGIETLTMRELAGRLGIEAASLYNHVSGKDDLLAGMADLVIAEIDLPSEDSGWREAMRRRAMSARELFERHGWAAALIDTRMQAQPSGLAYADRVLGTLLRVGLSPAVAGNAFLVLDSYIYGYERQRTILSRDDGGDSTDTAQEVGDAIPPGAFPALAAVAAAYAKQPFDEDAGFAFGLELLLDGIERLLPTG
ncbi:MAG: TetR/AcrR family transcriptional regulator [Chloroflexota bacterium]|nr:MAG: TetR/AcrR family transcriptional regulator [Chloroflexota bacterium]